MTRGNQSQAGYLNEPIVSVQSAYRAGTRETRSNQYYSYTTNPSRSNTVSFSVLHSQTRPGIFLNSRNTKTTSEPIISIYSVFSLIKYHFLWSNIVFSDQISFSLIKYRFLFRSSFLNQTFRFIQIRFFWDKENFTLFLFILFLRLDINLQSFSLI